MSEKSEPHYDLAWLQKRVATGESVVTKRVERYLRRKGYPSGFPEACVATLKPSDFYKSQEHVGRQDVWLDVYRPVIADQRWYVKVARYEDGIRAVVLSCCRDGEAH